MSKTRDALAEEFSSKYFSIPVADLQRVSADSFREGWDQCDSEAVKLLERIANHNCEIWPGSLDKKCGKCSVCLARKFIEERK